jgi:hypothetical protein
MEQRYNQHFEKEFWGDCINTFREEEKQRVIARFMGLQELDHPQPPVFDLSAKSVVDVGGGPVSLLLKCINRGDRCAIVDPGAGYWPRWVRMRYHEAGIQIIEKRGEDLDRGVYDEAWCYNVLQHVDVPSVVAERMKRVSWIQRVFEWIEIPPHEGHPHKLTARELQEWFGPGHKLYVDEGGCVGLAWFNGPHLSA